MLFGNRLGTGNRLLDLRKAAGHALGKRIAIGRRVQLTARHGDGDRPGVGDPDDTLGSDHEKVALLDGLVALAGGVGLAAGPEIMGGHGGPLSDQLYVLHADVAVATNP